MGFIHQENMLETQLTHLRSLRRRCQDLLKSAAADISSFIADDELTFRWLQQSSQDHVSIASTCTCLMTAVTAAVLERIYISTAKTQDPTAFSRGQAVSALKKVFGKPWVSSGIPDGNPFTAVIVARTTALLCSERILPCEEGRALEHTTDGQNRTLERVILDLADGAPHSLDIHGTAAHPGTMFWLVDAAERLGITIPGTTWQRLAKWAASTFLRELSQVVAENDAIMDPVALVMAACLCRRIQMLAGRDALPDSEAVLGELPSQIELQYGVKQFLNKQQLSGLWPNYFPLFRYGNAANYCFTFECLEAIILSFKDGTLFDDEMPLEKFARALAWCEQSKLTYASRGRRYSGWNSGGDRGALALGQPEVWATGTVHIFAQHFQELLDGRIQKAIERKYGATVDFNPASWDQLIDLPLRLGNEETTLKTVLANEFIDPISEGRKLERRSALLFGPPGTSKTSLVRAIAENVGWAMVEITPARFLRQGLEKVYVSAEEIFEDMSDLRRAVVLFDEMDALVRNRDPENQLDTTQQFLTTTMLPIITQLHKKKDVIFFIATNHQQDFDPAIKRPGRFDMLLCIGLPQWDEKLKRIEVFCPKDDADELRKLLGDLIQTGTAHMLNYFTYGEFASLLSEIRRDGKCKTYAEALRKLPQGAFHKIVLDWYDNRITLREEGPTRAEFKNDLDASQLQ